LRQREQRLLCEAIASAFLRLNQLEVTMTLRVLS